MSATPEDVSGLQPAVKAGGMRVKQSKQSEDKYTGQAANHSVLKTQVSTESQVARSDTKEALSLAKANALIMGSSTEAVQNTHAKPSPTHEKPVQNKQQNRTIHQPR